MKLLDAILDRALKTVHGTRLEQGVDAMDTFLRHPISPPPGPPYLRRGMDAKRFMFTVVVALIPPTLASVYFFGLRALLGILTAYAAGGVVEMIFATVRRHPVSEGFLVTGLLFPLVLPADIPLWMVALGCMFGVFFGKEVFGGVGKNIFNPALVGRAFLFLSFPKAMSTGWIIKGQGTLGKLMEAGMEPVADVVTSATPMITAKLAASSGGSASQAMEAAFSSYQLLSGYLGGSLGGVSAIAILVGGVILFGSGVGNWRAPFAAILSLVATSGLLHTLDPARFISPFHSLVAGGFLFGATYMLTDPVSAPGTNVGRYVYGAFVGLLVVLIRGLSGFPEGVMFAILIMNIFAPLLDQGALALHRRRLRHV